MRFKIDQLLRAVQADLLYKTRLKHRFTYQIEESN